MNTLGVAISTRNRPESLAMCLAHCVAYEPFGGYNRIIVCDDRSNSEVAANNATICAHWGVEYHCNKEWLGVAKTKNVGLKSLTNCSHVFLFDDDCFPDNCEWYEAYVRAHEQTGAHHMTYTPWHPNERVVNNAVFCHPWGMGSCLFFTQQILTAIGGFDSKYNYFGYEHMAYARRAARSGLNGDYGAYITPILAIDKIYALDYEYAVLDKQPSLGTIDFAHTRTVKTDNLWIHMKANRQQYELDDDALYVEF